MKLRQIKRWLKKNYPLNHPVRIYFVDGKKLKETHGCECFADCELKDGKIFIRLNRNLKSYEIPPTIIHEWSHAILYNLPDSLFDGPHDSMFSIVNQKMLNDYLQQT
jgi:hypothetical protein